MKGIFDIDNPLMTGIAKIADCICASLLWIVFSLPVVTIGASSAALYTTVYKYLRRDHGHLWQTFWAAFRENLRRSTLVWLIALALMAVLSIDVWVLHTRAVGSRPLEVLYWIVIVIYCIALTWVAYLMAYGARFDGSVKDVLHFSFLMIALHPLKALLVFLTLLCGGILILVMPGLIAVVPAAVCWINSIIQEKVFLLHMSPEDVKKTEASQETQRSLFEKWF